MQLVDGHIGIVGGRDFNDRKLLYETMVSFATENGEFLNIVVVSGGAKGADSLGEQFASKCLTQAPIIYKPDPKIIEEKGFAAAAFARNQQIVDASDFIIAFWDGKSRGTKDTINKAAKAKKPVIIIWY